MMRDTGPSSSKRIEAPKEKYTFAQKLNCVYNSLEPIH
jgi:hypothetical protein